MTPAYVRPTQEGLFRHFAAVARSSRVPVLLYNVPGRTAVDLLPATVARLSRVPKIVGIKEAVGEAARVRELAGSCAAGFRSPERRRSDGARDHRRSVPWA